MKIAEADAITRRIYLMRSRKVMLDRDLAELYGVKAIALRQQVKRNHDRFPEDFMFQLSEEEVGLLVSQSVIPSKRSLGGFLPYAFTQEGVAMLSSVLRSKKAVQVNIAVMRAFVKLSQLLASRRELASRLETIEKHLASHDTALGDHAEHIRAVFKAMRRLTNPPKSVAT